MKSSQATFITQDTERPYKSISVTCLDWLVPKEGAMESPKTDALGKVEAQGTLGKYSSAQKVKKCLEWRDYFCIFI